VRGFRSSSMLDHPTSREGRGWRFIDLAGLGINTARSYVAALLWIVLCPLAVAVVLGAAAGISGVIKQRPQDVLAPTTAILEQYGPIVVAGAALLYAVARIHRRPWQSLIAPDLRLDGARLSIGFAVQIAILGGQLELIHVLSGWPWIFKSPEPLPIFLLALVLIPLQAASEELLFRGYLTQTLGRVLRSRVAIVFVVALAFGGLHLNVHGPLTVPFFVLVSLVFSIVSLRDERLELAVGGHAAMNLFAFVVAATVVLGPVPGDSSLNGSAPGASAAIPTLFNWIAVAVPFVNGALFYGLTRLLVRLVAR
jgi:membrane protease YdiL (CAAX protease family)